MMMRSALTLLVLVTAAASFAACGDDDPAPTEAVYVGPEGFILRDLHEGERPLLGTYAHDVKEPRPGGMRRAELTLFDGGTHSFRLIHLGKTAADPEVVNTNEGTWFTEGTARLFLSHKRANGAPANMPEIELRIGKDGLRQALDLKAPPLIRVDR